MDYRQRLALLRPGRSKLATASHHWQVSGAPRFLWRGGFPCSVALAIMHVHLSPRGATPTTSPRLDEPVWRERARAHEARVRAWTDPHQSRAARGEKHPVYDFLFTYYGHRPSWLRRWFPGPGLVLGGEGARAWLARPEYRETSDTTYAAAGGALSAPGIAGMTGITLGPLPEKRRPFVLWLRALLLATRERPAFFGCFGLHEWAMVYRQTPEEVRHNQYPLRFPPADIARFVEAQPLRCSHYDAFRFFTAPARPLNRAQLARETTLEHEQAGCLHANMDLYKWAYKLAPFAPAELVADCFELARDIRELDMRASPYDLAALGFAPVKIETPEGRADYERAQRTFAERARPLRERLLACCDWALASAPAALAATPSSLATAGDAPAASVETATAASRV